MERPFVFINSAMSADGKISTKERKQVKISGSFDFDRVDALRAGSDAVMVGIGTVIADDPSLTVKSEKRQIERKQAGLEENPVRVVVDSNAKIPLDADIFKKGEGRRIVIVSGSASSEKLRQLEDVATIIIAGEDKVDLAAAMEELRKTGINRLMVEGGATLNWGMLSNGLVDEVYTFIGNLIIGGNTSPTFVDGEGFTEKEIMRLDLFEAEGMEEGILLKWKVLPCY
ncbi:2,5-diamino-6-(ribosylamino)-4(3H)-pyrimidinone 5'-phosphate reductase [Methanolobus halotolerans]|uniref:2,5-diamino-6-(ribosylamino)-4(3H)-pyrimidinone 5'-phosphate reductase n=1 Tax=Methanolobus halotolerans TaxID=2052935 RepID=A0A4E0PXZ7_9EURY|nr:2,5-diamino-6-(ribosylamino)-4(3H)-pyrimidinone 5'-phosphate reductase [Methanolobus halotolerans]TGC11088.1 2,5-diamino-6-(ribosylamino)-4(3H)-pyrimidinone 5'-phosphate reductase [Methanolobus halotolerans]